MNDVQYRFNRQSIPATNAMPPPRLQDSLHLREVLASPLYADFKGGKADWRAALKTVSGQIQADLGLSYDFETLAPARDLTHLEKFLADARDISWEDLSRTSRNQNASPQR